MFINSPLLGGFSTFLPSLQTAKVSNPSYPCQKIILVKINLFCISHGSNPHSLNFQAQAQPSSHQMFLDILRTHVLIL